MTLATALAPLALKVASPAFVMLACGVGMALVAGAGLLRWGAAARDAGFATVR